MMFRAVLAALTSMQAVAAPADTALPVTAPSAADKPLVLKIGVNDIYCTKTACECIGEIATRSYDGTLAALARDHNIRLEFTYFMEVMELEKELEAKRFDGALCKPWTALRLAEKSGAKFSRVADVRDPEDRAMLAGWIVVPVKSPLRKLADLAGCKVAFGREDSYEKHHAPLGMLAAAKVKPSGGLYFSSCGENLDALMNGTVDAAVISDYALSASCAVDFAKPEDFRVIAKTAEMPLTSLLVDLNKVPAADAARLQRALLAVSGAKVADDLTGKGFVKPVSWRPVAAPAAPPPELKKKEDDP